MFKRLRFNWKAQTAHGLHSPFVFGLYTKVIDPIYKQNPPKLKEALIHGIGAYGKIAEGNLHVIDLLKLKNEDIAEIEVRMKDTANLLVCLDPQANSRTYEIWTRLYQNKAVIHSIELFELGILSLSPTAPKQHFWLKKS
jgi:hypothetical protein